MAEDFPLMPVIAGGPAAPLESSTQSAPSDNAQTGTLESTFKADYYNSPVVNLLNRGIGQVNDDTPVPYDQAVAAIKAQNLDPAFIPKAGMTHGALRREAERQAAVKMNELRTQRAGGGGTVSNIATGLAAGLADPSNIVLGPLGGEILNMARGGLAARAAIGGATGAAYTGAFSAGEAHLSGHDEDINSWSMLSTMTTGAAFGGITHAAFGPRPRAPVPGDIDSHIAMIRTGEATAAASKRSGVPVNEVTSSAGAVGEFQVTPGTARQYGFDPAKLKDPAYNEQAARAILTDLDRKFNGDQEAIAVAYNAGPGWGRRFLRAGKDRSILPKETQDYLKRIDQNFHGTDTFGKAPEQTYAPYDYTQVRNPQDAIDDAHIALNQFANDEPVEPAAVRSNPFKIADEHFDEITDILSQATKAAAPWEQRLADYRAQQSQDPVSLLQPEERKQVQRLDATPPVKEATPEAPNPEADMHKQYVADTKAQFAGDPVAAERLDNAIAEAHAANEEGTQMKHDELTKTVEAAVKCGVLKGVQYGDA